MPPWGMQHGVHGTKRVCSRSEYHAAMGQLWPNADMAVTYVVLNGGVKVHVQGDLCPPTVSTGSDNSSAYQLNINLGSSSHRLVQCVSNA